MSASRLIDIARNLSGNLEGLNFSSPVSFVYDPTDYAREPFHLYVKMYGSSPKKVVLVGMNPGPWGMLQTGVPFGEVSAVRDWMGIQGRVGMPARCHPKRPVDGFASVRSEVSGRRLWGWARERFVTAEAFFRDFFVLNYCPLAFFDGAGKNITPDRLKAEDKARLFRLCNPAVRQAVSFLKPEFVVGVGKFACEMSSAALEGTGIRVGRITHPSPANPVANRGWEEIVERELKDMGMEIPLNVSV
jgi:single-strand selective monofunctional uracil DNA glycosylase